MGAKASRYSESVGTCAGCGKQDYTSRKNARTAAKKAHPGDSCNAYECPEGTGYFHYGHLQRKIKRGHMPRALLVDGATLRR